MACSATGGMKLVDTGDGDGHQKVNPGMDCPLCVSIAPMTDSRGLSFEQPSPLSYALQPIAAAIIALATAPPLPSRGVSVGIRLRRK